MMKVFFGEKLEVNETGIVGRKGLEAVLVRGVLQIPAGVEFSSLNFEKDQSGKLWFTPGNQRIVKTVALLEDGNVVVVSSTTKVGEHHESSGGRGIILSIREVEF